MNRGFVHDLDEQTYHADPDTLSVSGAKVLLKAPALYQHQRANPLHKDVFDFGSAAHQEVLGVGPGLAIIPATGRTKAEQTAHREAKEAAYADGKIPLSADDHATVRAMADVLSAHDTAMALLSDGKPEVSAFAVDGETGVGIRGRFDWLRDDLAVDYKSAASAHPDAFAKACANFDYAMQHAWYVDLAAALEHPLRGFVFIAQEKTAPYLVECYELDADAVDLGRLKNRAALERYRDCTASGRWPGYTGATAITSLSLPGWAYRQDIPA